MIISHMASSYFPKTKSAFFLLFFFALVDVASFLAASAAAFRDSPFAAFLLKAIAAGDPGAGRGGGTGGSL